jgi:hypothetical protein
MNGCVWDCGNGDDSKCFLLRNASIFYYFYFFLKSAHQNNSKHKKNIILNKIK